MIFWDFLCFFWQFWPFLIFGVFNGFLDFFVDFFLYFFGLFLNLLYFFWFLEFLKFLKKYWFSLDFFCFFWDLYLLVSSKCKNPACALKWHTLSAPNSQFLCLWTFNKDHILPSVGMAPGHRRIVLQLLLGYVSSMTMTTVTMQYLWMIRFISNPKVLADPV